METSITSACQANFLLIVIKFSFCSQQGRRSFSRGLSEPLQRLKINSGIAPFRRQKSPHFFLFCLLPITHLALSERCICFVRVSFLPPHLLLLLPTSCRCLFECNCFGQTRTSAPGGRRREKEFEILCRNPLSPDALLWGGHHDLVLVLYIGCRT